MWTSVENANIDTVQKFSLKNNKLYKFKLSHVIDGDTIKGILKPWIFGKCYLFSIRLIGFDAPEIRTLNLEEKRKGQKAKEYLINIIKDTPILYVECGDFDAFGRILGKVFLDKSRNTPVNDLMDIYCQYHN